MPRVILHVGDIVNCYDELDHDDCLDGVACALSKVPKWHRPTVRPMRVIDRYSVYKVGRKDITVGSDLTRERTRIELSTKQTPSVREFDRHQIRRKNVTLGYTGTVGGGRLWVF